MGRKVWFTVLVWSVASLFTPTASLSPSNRLGLNETPKRPSPALSPQVAAGGC